ncbi:MAG TPA: GAF domain-containing protein, partial [candidate division Zixibacteria bacterium]|nr:GAF domain-containing protein [candidate division Zixibacteria bacterium]
ELYEDLEQKVKERTGDLIRRNLELAALIKTNQSISAGLDLSRVLEIAVREAVRIMNVSYCSIILIKEGDEYGSIASEYSPADDLETSVGERLHLEDCPTLKEAYHGRQYIMIADTSNADLSPKEKEMMQRLDIRSILVVPLVHGEKALGIMQLSSFGQIKEFNKEEVEVCQTIANQVVIAIENAHLYSELKQHDKTLEILFEIDRAVSLYLDLDDLLRDVVSKTIQLTSSDAGWIYLLKEDGETLKLETSIGISPELIEAASILKVGQGVSGMAVRSGKPVIMDINNYPYAQILPLMIKNSITSLAGVPLMAKGRIVGAMVLSNSEQRIFSSEDIDIISSIGNHIGVAVENARLYSELKRHDSTMEALFEIDRVISQSLDLDEIFKEALAKTIQVTSSDAGAIYQFDKDQENLSIRTSSGVSEEFVSAVSRIKLGEKISGVAAKTKKPFVTDIDHPFPTPDLLPFLEKEGLITVVGTPLIAKGNVVGAMSLANRYRRVFSKEDLDLLESIGNQIGVAIENARLYTDARVSFEKLQKAYKELESLDRMKSEFLSNVSHELKTPLVSVRGYSELMYDGKLGEVSQSQKKAFEAIIRNTDRLLRLIDSLLFLSIQQMGKPDFKMRPTPLNVDELITSSLADMKVRAEKQNISLVKDVPPDLVMTGDRDRLTEVFLNLLDNAIKFTPVDGIITVRATEEEAMVHITVADTGIGIPDDVIPSLFQRFYQVDASLTRKYGGTGLGLYISKSIIDAHNGQI